MFEIFTDGIDYVSLFSNLHMLTGISVQTLSQVGLHCSQFLNRTTLAAFLHD